MEELPRCAGPVEVLCHAQTAIGRASGQVAPSSPLGRPIVAVADALDAAQELATEVLAETLTLCARISCAEPKIHHRVCQWLIPELGGPMTQTRADVDEPLWRVRGAQVQGRAHEKDQ